ncbi:MAG: dTDP-glucose 4,6-dehydratase [Candidatus Brocadiae bacterium]|nr:dTDP-glucose 4,6-dehydratase [Candidatus Brocadiia bacterium]
MKLFVTGGCGFIGSNFVRLVLRERPDIEMVNFDALTYAGNLENLRDLEGEKRHRFVRGSICDRAAVDAALAGGCDILVNFAAESHVDRSIHEPQVFLETNVRGTATLLEAAVKAKVRRFVQISTDEVYGSLGPTGVFTEATPIQPSSPYSAAKAAADQWVLAYHHTFGTDVVVTRSSNNYGPYQFPEKLIPLFISNALEDKPLPVYGDGRQVRDWLHVDDNCRAILRVAEKAAPGSVYNIGGQSERENIDVTRALLRAVGKPETLIRHVQDRPGHDRRYALDISKIRRELGWEPTVKFEEGLQATVDWYLKNREWWGRVKSGAYREYYEKQYAGRLEGGGARGR